MLTGKRILVTGGTGTLGRAIIQRIMSGSLGMPEKVVVLSRDEAKQQALQIELLHPAGAHKESDIGIRNGLVEFRIGDVSDYYTMVSALRDADIAFNTAALKQVPACEYAPFEAVRTNILGAQNLVQAIRQYDLPVEAVIGVSTDKACKPVNAMGMTKALQERLFVQANLLNRKTRFVVVRYGNILASRGSVIPLFKRQIEHGGPVTVTGSQMTRFLLSVGKAVDTCFTALKMALAGEIFIPMSPAARIRHVAQAMIGDRPIAIEERGIRPGEKVHEILVSEEEVQRTRVFEDWGIIEPALPELSGNRRDLPRIEREYCSADHLLSKEEVTNLLSANDLSP